MPDNFFITAEQMRDSSKVLHHESHFHNACYLSGYVGECYLKLLVGQIPSGSSPRTYRHNLQNLYQDLLHFTTSSANTSNLRRYLLDMPIDCPNIHAQWSPNKRYDDNAGWNNQTMSQSFQNDKEKCYDKIIEMFVDGII